MVCVSPCLSVSPCVWCVRVSRDDVSPGVCVPGVDDVAEVGGEGSVVGGARGLWVGVGLGEVV